MSVASIIQQLTLNQPLTFTTPTGIDRVKIHNDSSYYLRVYFGLGAPGDANSGGWHDTISPGASPVIAVVGAAKAVQGLDLTNSQSIGSYQGQVIVLPFSPAGASQSGGGVLSGGSICYLTSFYPGEYAEAGGQIEAYVQGAKQGRYQQVLGAGIGLIGSTTQVTADKTQIGTNLLTLSATSHPNLFAANKAFPVSVINVYVYSYCMSAISNGVNAASVAYFLDFAVTDSTRTTTRDSQEFWRGIIAVFATATDENTVIVNDNFGLGGQWIQLQIPQNTLVSGDLIIARYRTTGTFGNYNMAHNIRAVVDKVNQTPNLGYTFVSDGTFAALNYNAGFNPQTY